jgi:peptide/nickel transport system permease protein
VREDQPRLGGPAAERARELSEARAAGAPSGRRIARNTLFSGVGEASNLILFFLGFLAQLVFADLLGWLPVSGRASPEVTATLSQHTHLFLIDTLIDGDLNAFWDCFLHLILPAVTLGLVTSGVLIRLVRVNLMQTMKGDYVEAARARGLSERRVVLHHAFRNALVPVITVAGLQLALLLGGAILTEETFNWPGIGFQLVRYLNERDYVAVQGIITVFALAVVAVSVLIDLVNAFVDPRVRYS